MVEKEIHHQNRHGTKSEVVKDVDFPKTMRI